MIFKWRIVRQFYLGVSKMSMLSLAAQSLVEN